LDYDCPSAPFFSFVKMKAQPQFCVLSVTGFCWSLR
jgi:hypothetical protein